MSGIVGSYFNTRGSGVVAKLGTDGQVFTSTGAGLSQGFEAAAGGGDCVKLATATPVSGTTVDMTSVFSSTYRFYKLFIWDVEWGDANRPEVSFLVSGTEDTGTYYEKMFVGNGAISGWGTNSGHENNSDGFRLSNGYGHETGQNPNFTAEMTFFNPNSNVTYIPVTFLSSSWDGSQYTCIYGIGHYATEISATGIRFKGSAGGTFTSGALELYGFTAG